MCRELETLRQSIVTYAGAFDAAALTPARAAVIVGICAQMEASMASLKALAAVRAAEGNAWQRDGYRSPADGLAHQAGMSPAAAKRALETGRRMATQPEVANAALVGELSAEQAHAVADGVAANPGKATELIDKAKRSSLAELNEEVARTKAAVTDQEARRRAIHAKRALRRWTDRDGALQAHLYGHPEDGAGLWRMLDPIRRRLTILRRGATPNDSLDALDYDALMAVAAVAVGHDGEVGLADLLDLGLFPQLDPALLASRTSAPTTERPPPTAGPTEAPTLLTAPPADPSGPSPPPKPPLDRPPKKRGKKLAGSPARIIIRVDFDTLLRGVALEGELCEIAGYGPIPVSVIEDLLANENAFIVGALTKGKNLIGVYHHGRRHPDAYQKSGLDFVYPTCAVEGCSARAGLQSDHRDPWATTNFTVFDLLDRLCPHHHGLKTHKGWALVEGTGKRAFVPPDDARHPRHSQHPP